MTDSRIPSPYSLLIALVALLVATIALFTAKQTRQDVQEIKQVALSEIEVTERNSLITPILDEESKRYRYLAIYEVGVTNLGGPNIAINELGKLTSGSEFIVLLKGEEVVSANPQYHAFLVEPTLREIGANPKLLKGVMEKDMGEAVKLDVPLPFGATKTLRFGVVLDVYDDANIPLANVVLLSYQLKFSNGKSYLFRRGFPVQPLVAS